MTTVRFKAETESISSLNLSQKTTTIRIGIPLLTRQERGKEEGGKKKEK